MRNWEMPVMEELMIEETACTSKDENGNCNEPGCPTHDPYGDKYKDEDNEKLS